MRQRRHRTLLKKIREFSGLFDEDVAIVLRDKTTGESKVYKSADDPEWLPELSHQVGVLPASHIHLANQQS